MRLLILRISSPTRDAERTHIFTEAGGRIGRAEDNSWVLGHPKVSSHHAVISFSGSQFYLQDTSQLGVVVNYVREVGDRPYALKVGDRLFIEPYEIEVAVENQTESQDARPPDWQTRHLGDPFSTTGLPADHASPELAGDLGQILRVVVGGLMDLLSSRRLIKDEFHIRQTVARRPDNNPLKVSANADDALYNLLVKRNPSYLRGPHAFIDAFDDLRDHQLATLAAMRMAFEGMLADFDPDRMQEQSAPAKAPAMKRNFRSRSTGQSVQNRTPISLQFSLRLPSVTATVRWRGEGGPLPSADCDCPPML